jgi:truncated hemoglobin YjbI
VYFVKFRESHKAVENSTRQPTYWRAGRIHKLGVPAQLVTDIPRTHLPGLAHFASKGGMMITSQLKEALLAAGGEPGVRKILSTFYKKMASDILVGFFFDGKDLEHIAKQQAEFLLRAAGLFQNYQGKGPAQAHEKLPPILAGHFDRRTVLLRETLNEAGLASEFIETWIGFERQFRKAIVKEEVSLG